MEMPRCGTHIWGGYNKISGVQPVIGGMHHNIRYLWEYEK